MSLRLITVPGESGGRGKGDLAVIVLEATVLSSTVIDALDGALDEVSRSRNTRGLVIVSDQPHFGHGADVKEIRPLCDRAEDEAYTASQRFKAVFSRFGTLTNALGQRVRTGTVIKRGNCLGGALELALSTEIIFAGEEAKFGLPEEGIGLFPGAGACLRLPKRVGLERAFELVLQFPPKNTDAKKAWRIRLVDELLPDTDNEQVLKRAWDVLVGGAKPKRYRYRLTDWKHWLVQCPKDWFVNHTPVGRRIAGNRARAEIKAGGGDNYPALTAGLEVVLAGAAGGSWTRLCELESRRFAQCVTSPTCRAMIDSFNGQQALKRNTQARGFTPVVEAGVLGVGGNMGAQIAEALLGAGEFRRVVVTDLNQKALDNGVARIRAGFGAAVSKGKMPAAEAELRLAALAPTLDPTGFNGCGIVIEAVFERLDVKREALGRLRQAMKVPCHFLTNTSSLRVHDVANGDEHVCGFHLFNPVRVMQLAELIPAGAAPETVLAAKWLAGVLRKSAVIIQKDCPGFLVNHILGAVLITTIDLMALGLPWETIDKAARKAGFPMGTVQLIDAVGPKVAIAVLRSLEGGYGDRFALPPFLQEMEQLDLPGAIGGKGFYLYTKGGKDQRPTGRNPEVERLIMGTRTASFALPAATFDIGAALLSAASNAAAGCLADGIVTNPGDLDAAVVLGTGIAPFRGGLLRPIDALDLSGNGAGAHLFCRHLETLGRQLQDRWAVAGRPFPEGHLEHFYPCDLLQEMDRQRTAFYGQERVST